MNLIILTHQQADQVRGTSPNGLAALDPRETLGGDFVLPARVLEDPAHQAHYDLLSSLPQMDVSEAQFPVSEEEDL